MNIEVKGHSGCLIEVVREGDELFVYKSTHDKGYLKRLALQADKQMAAQRDELQHIRVPQVLAVEKNSEVVNVKMEYVYSKNFIDYFETSGFEQISYFVKALRIFLDFEIRHSDIQTIPASVIKEKFDSVCQKVNTNPCLSTDSEIVDLMNRSATLFGQASDMKMPVGKCHGDLTFSNILFNGNNYYLIDFLDSFVESPLLDIVKIRQDSAFLWSRLMYTGDYDQIRLRIVADRIDRKIVEYASQYEWYQYYPMFQLMNFLRILQYAKEDKVISYLKTIIKQLLHEF